VISCATTLVDEHERVIAGQRLDDVRVPDLLKQ
jgi:hypothetical protein